MMLTQKTNSAYSNPPQIDEEVLSYSYLLPQHAEESTLGLPWLQPPGSIVVIAVIVPPRHHRHRAPPGTVASPPHRVSDPPCNGLNQAPRSFKSLGSTCKPWPRSPFLRMIYENLNEILRI
jgi:hypothetical protein